MFRTPPICVLPVMWIFCHCEVAQCTVASLALPPQCTVASLAPPPQCTVASLAPPPQCTVASLAPRPQQRLSCIWAPPAALIYFRSTFPTLPDHDMEIVFDVGFDMDDIIAVRVGWWLAGARNFIAFLRFVCKRYPIAQCLFRLTTIVLNIVLVKNMSPLGKNHSLCIFKNTMLHETDGNECVWLFSLSARLIPWPLTKSWPNRLWGLAQVAVAQSLLFSNKETKPLLFIQTMLRVCLVAKQQRSRDLTQWHVCALLADRSTRFECWSISLWGDRTILAGGARRWSTGSRTRPGPNSWPCCADRGLRSSLLHRRSLTGGWEEAGRVLVISTVCYLNVLVISTVCYLYVLVISTVC